MESQQAEVYLQFLAEGEIRRASAGEYGLGGRPESGPATSATKWPELAATANEALDLESSLPPGELTWLVATTLAKVGAVDQASAMRIVGELDIAFATLDLNKYWASPRPRPAAWPALSLGREGSRSPGRGITEPVHVTPAAGRLPLGMLGERATLKLLAYVQTSRKAIFVGHGPRVPARIPLKREAVDDQGRRYQLTFRHIGSGSVLWEASLHPPPLRGAAMRWLEAEPLEGGPPLRVAVDAQALAVDASVTPVTARSKAELLIEAAATDLLAAALMPVPVTHSFTPAEAEAAGMAGVLLSLWRLGLLSAGSPALLRLLAVCNRLGIVVPGEPFQRTELNDQLPGSWQAVLTKRNRRDGQNAVMSLAIELPRINGARLVLTALESGPKRALLHVLASGWTPPNFDLRAFSGAGESPLSWWAQDDAGRWHTASGGNWFRHSDQEWSGVVQLRPPLHPAANSLVLTITGTSERLHVKMPLHWHSLETP